jgi:hypothetical protein
MKLERAAWGSLLLLIVLNLGLFWLSRYVPTQDGACHLENALHLRDLCLPGCDGAERCYRFNAGAGSNLLYHVTVAAFAAALPPYAAERLFLSLYLLCFAAATYAFARAAGARTALPAVAALPYALAFPFHMGFFNYCAGLVIAFAAWAYFWRRRDALRGRDALVLNVAAVLAYFTHAAAAFVLVAGLAGLNAWLAAGELSQRRGTLKRRLAVCAMLLPACALPVYFLVSHPPAAAVRLPWGYLGRLLVTGSSFRFFGAAQLYLGIASLVVVAGAAVLRAVRGARELRRPLSSRNAILALALGAVALYFLAPDEAGTYSVISARLLVIPWLVLLVWAGDDFGRAGRWAMLAAATAFGLAFWADTLCHYRKFNRGLRDLCSGAAHVEEGATLAYLYFSGWQYRIAVFATGGSHYAIQAGAVNFNNYEGDQPAFPVNFDYAGLRPLPPDLKPCADYRVRKFAPAVDYVVTWGLPERKPIARKLWRYYDGVHYRGKACVFRVKEEFREAPPPAGRTD